jgi:hypothetical protein
MSARHKFALKDTDATDLYDWSTGRPRLDRKLKLRRLNKPVEDGLVVDSAKAWDCLSKRAPDLSKTHGVMEADLILGIGGVVFIDSSRELILVFSDIFETARRIRHVQVEPSSKR